MIASFSSALIVAVALSAQNVPLQSYEFSVVNTEPQRKGGEYILLVANAIISPPLDSWEKEKTENTLHALLSRLRQEAERNGQAIDGVSAYLYQSKAHITGGNGPIGMVEWWPKGHSFSPENDENIRDKTTFVESVKILLLPTNASKPLDKLSEAVRREIFTAIVAAEDRANREAEKKYPVDSINIPDEKLRDYDWKSAIEKNLRESESLVKKYKMDIARKHKITESELEQIGLEGLERQWPFPPSK
jgi:hypothetical protein